MPDTSDVDVNISSAIGYGRSTSKNDPQSDRMHKIRGPMWEEFLKLKSNVYIPQIHTFYLMLFTKLSEKSIMESISTRAKMEDLGNYLYEYKIL